MFSDQATVTSLDLASDQLEWDRIYRLLHLFPHLLNLSLRGIHLHCLAASVLHRASELDIDGETVPAAFPTLQTIWLARCRFEDEDDLRSLIRLWASLKQLKLSSCALTGVGSILKVQSLQEYLLGSVSDLIINE